MTEENTSAKWYCDKPAPKPKAVMVDVIDHSLLKETDGQASEVIRNLKLADGELERLLLSNSEFLSLKYAKEYELVKALEAEIQNFRTELLRIKKDSPQVKTDDGITFAMVLPEWLDYLIKKCN